jgi:hypothetical protein
MTPLIRKLSIQLQELSERSWSGYTVPGAWVESPYPVEFPSGAAFLLHQLSLIDSLERRYRHREWKIERALAYNGMVRHIASYNHGPNAEAEGWRTTGTFLKLAAMVPYLLSLGVDTLVLLPITQIGSIGRKGTLGSPYAVKHPLHLDPNLAEPSILLSIEDQARILVEVCHLVGIKVILEIVLRTASVDSDLVPQHPEWFYWIDEELALERFGGFVPPQFSAKEIGTMTELVDNHRYIQLPEPPSEYQELFQTAPIRVERDEFGWKGIAARNRSLRIPGAFADWPVDDKQPVWTDVTYLRLHDHPRYRYMAYNTVRMYERDLEKDEYRAHTLWNTIAGLIPYYQRTLNIDGSMIDMGHALPRDLRRHMIAEARSSKPSFLLFEENFALEAASKIAGYDAAVGYLPFDAMDPEKLRGFVERVSHAEIPIRYFSTPESHNTPRAVCRVKESDNVGTVWSVLRILTGGLGFIHAGMELEETVPVNTGLGFLADELEIYTPEKLPLFSDIPLPWDSESATLGIVKSVNKELSSSSWWVTASDDDDIIIIDTKKKELLAFVRRPYNGRQGILCVANLSSASLRERIALPKESGIMFLAPNLFVSRAGKGIAVELNPWQVEYVFTLH